MIGGYTDPAGSRTDFGALLVGYYEDGELRYAGKVGTGYSAATLRDLGARLRKLETPESPFVDARPIPRGTHWTRPELVAQIGFAEWTSGRSAAAAALPRAARRQAPRRRRAGAPGEQSAVSADRVGADRWAPAGDAARGGPADGGAGGRGPGARPGRLFDGLPSDLWGALVLQVIGQQLSLRCRRRDPRRGSRRCTATGCRRRRSCSATDAETLRGVGLSRAKAAYLHDLAARLEDGRLDLDRLRDPRRRRGPGRAHPGQGRRPLHRRRRAACSRCAGRTCGPPPTWRSAGRSSESGGSSRRPRSREVDALGERFRPWRTLAAAYLYRSRSVAT